MSPIPLTSQPVIPKTVVALAIAVLGITGCVANKESGAVDDEKIVSRTVRDMVNTTSKNGKRSQTMRSTLVEEHAFAKTPFTEHPNGIEVVGYDSLGVKSASRVMSDHALHWTGRDMWQLSGNVYVEGEDGERLYTQQLFWDRKTRKIWSNVDCKFERGSEVFVGVGFDAMDDFSYAAVRNITGFFSIDTEPTADSVVSEPLSVPSAPSVPSNSSSNSVDLR